MNDELMELYSLLEYAVRQLQCCQIVYCKPVEEKPVLLEFYEKQVDALLLQLEAARKRPPQEAGEGSV